MVACNQADQEYLSEHSGGIKDFLSIQVLENHEYLGELWSWILLGSHDFLKVPKIDNFWGAYWNREIALTFLRWKGSATFLKFRDPQKKGFAYVRDLWFSFLMCPIPKYIICKHKLLQNERDCLWMSCQPDVLPSFWEFNGSRKWKLASHEYWCFGAFDESEGGGL